MEEQEKQASKRPLYMQKGTVTARIPGKMGQGFCAAGVQIVAIIGSRASDHLPR